MTDWPIIEIEDSLYHVGSLDPAQKGKGSYEGHGLSVSCHPDDWRYIAKLPGDDWLLEKPDHNFLDVHALTEEQKSAIFDWAVRQGLCERTSIFQSVRYDDEWECDLVSLHVTHEEAVAEQGWEIASDGTVLDEDGDPIEDELLSEHICKRDGLIAHPEFLVKMNGNVQDRLNLAEEFAIIAFAEQVLGLDGCWWEDIYDPDTLSCPRGVIFPEKLASWKVSVPDLIDEETACSAQP